MELNPKCRLCLLHKTSSRAVCIAGEGPIPSAIMFVAEAPGEDETIKKRPLVGKVGKLYNACLEEAGLDRKDVYSSNSVRCRPPSNRKPTKEEIAACRPYLEREIRQVKPKIIVCMGATAITSVLGVDNPVIKTSRGFVIWSDEFACHIIITYHPGAIMPYRDPKGLLKKRFIADLRLARMEIDGISGNKKHQCVVVNSLKKLKELHGTVCKATEISYDTENGGDTEDDALNPFRNIFLCLSISVDSKTGYVIPWRTQGRKLFWSSFERKKAHFWIQEIFNVMEEKRKKGLFIDGNNIVYDNLTLRVNGWIPPRPSCDNMIGDVLLDENRSHTLEAQTARWTKLGNYKAAFGLELNRLKIKDFSKIPNKLLWRYTGKDAIASRLIGPTVRKELRG